MKASIINYHQREIIAIGHTDTFNTTIHSLTNSIDFKRWHLMMILNTRKQALASEVKQRGWSSFASDSDTQFEEYMRNCFAET